jgi:hypothetical protein
VFVPGELLPGWAAERLTPDKAAAARASAGAVDLDDDSDDPGAGVEVA